MALFRRLVGWSAFLAFVSGVGWVAFFFVRNQPRCVIHDPGHILHLSDDGSRLITMDGGQLKIWDTHSGLLVRTFLDRGEDHVAECLPDKRLVVAVTGESLKIIDWQAGTEHTVPLPGWRDGSSYFQFSAHGKWLGVRQSRGDNRTHAFVDMDQRTVTLQGEFIYHNFCGDEGLVVLGDSSAQGVATAPVLLDLRTGKKMTQWEHGPASLAYSGKLLAVCFPARPLPDKEMTDLSLAYAELVVEVWDVTTMTRCFQHATQQDTCIASVDFTPDGRYLAVVFNDRDPGHRLTLFELSSGRVAFTAPIDSTFFSIQFAPDAASGQWLCLVDEDWLENPNRENRVSMWSVTTGELLWAKEKCHGASLLANAGRILFHPELHKTELLDARTGQSLTHKIQTNQKVQSTPDEGHILVTGRSPPPDAQNFLQTWLEEHWPRVFGVTETFALVMQTNTGREVFSIRTHEQRQKPGLRALRLSNRHHFLLLSANGGTLLTADYPDRDPWLPDPEEADTSEILFWDVYPQRAWTWTIGSAAAAGVGLLLLRAGWRHWRARRRSASASDPSHQPIFRRKSARPLPSAGRGDASRPPVE